jgi:hypothetical protein
MGLKREKQGWKNIRAHRTAIEEMWQTIPKWISRYCFRPCANLCTRYQIDRNMSNYFKYPFGSL